MGWLAVLRGKGQQMSRPWIEATIEAMEDSADAAVRKTADDMLEALGSGVTLTRKINVVDARGINRWHVLSLPD